MPTVNRWRELLHNNQNETNRIEIFLKYLKTSDVRQNISIPSIVTEKDATWHIAADSIYKMFSCNHEKPTRTQNEEHVATRIRWSTKNKKRRALSRFPLPATTRSQFVHTYVLTIRHSFRDGACRRISNL